MPSRTELLFVDPIQGPVPDPSPRSSTFFLGQGNQLPILTGQLLQVDGSGRRCPFDLTGWTVAEVKYPDAKNYEGRKILVYENLTARELRKVSVLDPHFCENSHHPSPIARFEPTPKGWKYAIAFAEAAS